MSPALRLESLVPLIIEQAARCPERRSVWIVLPSMQLVRALESLLLAEGEALVNVWLMTPSMAAEKILADRGLIAAPRITTRSMLALTCHVASELLEQAGSEERAELSYLLEYPDNAMGLLRVLRELRKEGMTGQEKIAIGSKTGRSSWKIMARLDQVLRERGCVDEAILVDRAMTAFEREVDADPQRVFFYGNFPRVTGSHRRLREAIGKRVETEDFIALTGSAMQIEEADSIPARARLLFSRDEAPPRALGSEQVQIYSAQGNEQELREALERARSLICNGCAPHRIAIVSPDISAYDPFLASLSTSMGVPVDCAIGTSLLCEPLALLAVDLLRLLADDFDRRMLMRCLADPFASRARFFADAESKGLFSIQSLGKIDERTREAACIAGRHELIAALGTEHALNAVLERLESYRRSMETATNSAQQAERLLEFMDDLIHAEDVRHDEILDEIKRCCRSIGERDLVGLHVLSMAELAQELRCALAEELSKHRAYREGGVQFLPIRRLPGLSFDHVFLLGFNRDRFPTRARSDAWLNEAERLLMRAHLLDAGAQTHEALLPPVPLARETEQTQREELRSVLHAARNSLCISFQRADCNGREQAPSLWLRHLTRALLGTEDTKSVLSAKSGHFAHMAFEPQKRLSARLGEGYPLSDTEALTLAAFARDNRALLRLGKRVKPGIGKDLERGLAMMARRERFHAQGATDLVYDAMQLGSVLDRTVPVTLFEKLGACPLQFYFAEVLGVRAIPDEPEFFEISKKHVGKSLHETMETLVKQMIEQGFFAFDAELSKAQNEATRLIDGIVERHHVTLTSRLEQRHAVLREQAMAAWKRGLADIIALDLEEAWEGDWRPERVEERLELDLELGGGGSTRHKVRFKGRLDRVDRHKDGRLRVIDYKSGGKFDGKKPLAEFYKGQRLQLPLYILMTSTKEQRSHAEFRGLSPRQLLQAEGRLPRSEVNAKLFQNPDALQETLGVLAQLLEHGDFPFRKGHHCEYCPYHAACPRHHRPSQDRLAERTELRLWNLLPDKGAETPLIADLGGSRGETAQ